MFKVNYCIYALIFSIFLSFQSSALYANSYDDKFVDDIATKLATKTSKSLVSTIATGVMNKTLGFAANIILGSIFDTTPAQPISPQELSQIVSKIFEADLANQTSALIKANNKNILLDTLNDRQNKLYRTLMLNYDPKGSDSDRVSQLKDIITGIGDAKTSIYDILDSTKSNSMQKATFKPDAFFYFYPRFVKYVDLELFYYTELVAVNRKMGMKSADGSLVGEEEIKFKANKLINDFSKIWAYFPGRNALYEPHTASRTDLGCIHAPVFLNNRNELLYTEVLAAGKLKHSAGDPQVFFESFENVRLKQALDEYKKGNIGILKGQKDPQKICKGDFYGTTSQVAYSQNPQNTLDYKANQNLANGSYQGCLSHSDDYYQVEVSSNFWGDLMMEAGWRLFQDWSIWDGISDPLDPAGRCDNVDEQPGAGFTNELPKARITDQKKLIPFNYRNDDIQDQAWYDNGVITFSKTGVPINLKTDDLGFELNTNKLVINVAKLSAANKLVLIPDSIVTKSNYLTGAVKVLYFDGLSKDATSSTAKEIRMCLVQNSIKMYDEIMAYRSGISNKNNYYLSVLDGLLLASAGSPSPASQKANAEADSSYSSAKSTYEALLGINVTTGKRKSACYEHLINNLDGWQPNF